ncbi:helix-turn-helix transcriptional regulator [Luteimicrobium sp. NPDC057192]|uniref:helix-turn-helix transcriptional regulator n=1 Tax=Luteimicrobium sp. NPDC057192 TaxID=3346042 RepID=UPI003644641C
MTPAPATRSGLRRDAVLRVLRDAGRPLTIADVATTLGVHPNTARFHLEALAADGTVERTTVAAVGPGRPPLAFRVRPGMDRHAPRHYEVLAGALVAHVARGPQPGRAAVGAGEAWGRAQAGRTTPPDAGPVAGLVGLLDDLGFAPETLTDGAKPDDGTDPREVTLGLRSCPFLELADDRAVVCGVHLGLMRGTLEAWGAPVRAESLEPFVQPDLCVAHLTREGNAL